MTKIGVLETISYPQNRVKFAGKWITYDPFLDMDALKFGNTYEAILNTNDKGVWYITQFTEVPVSGLATS